MLNIIVNRVKKLRENIYNFFPRRRDVAMELIDSLASNTNAKSVVELSLNSLYHRNYCSITRTVDEYYVGSSVAEKQEQNRQLTQLLSSHCPSLKKRPYHLFGLDCTSQPRVFAKTLADRGAVYAPNPILRSKPITVGHHYSLAVYLPEKLSEGVPPWVVPLSCERVSTQQKVPSLGWSKWRIA